MTIHRTRDGGEPSGGAELGRSIVQIGDTFIEYSGTVPDAAELDRHRHPPQPDPTTTPLTPEDIERLLLTIPDVTRAKIDAAKNNRGKPLP